MPSGQRELAAAEINRFVRTIGANRPVERITKLEVERYQQHLADTRGEASNRVEELKAFLTDLKTKKLTETNLGAGLRVRRKGGSGNARREEAQVVEVTAEGFEQLRLSLRTSRTRSRRRFARTWRRPTRTVTSARTHRTTKPSGAWARCRARSIDCAVRSRRRAIVQRHTSGERAGLGSKVILSDLEYDEELDYTLVGPGEVDTRKRRISIQSPVGNALKDHVVGDVVEVEIPSGLARYRIERIEQS